MDTFEWLKRELALVPRRKFHIVEPRSLSDLAAIETQYGVLPQDYREFVQRFGNARLFRFPSNQCYFIMVTVPPPEESLKDGTVRIELGYYFETGDAWIEWKNGVFLSDGALLSGRGKRIGCFGEWLKRSFNDCKRNFTSEQWAKILQPELPFSEQEKRIVEALPHFFFKKVGVTQSGNVLVEIENRSTTILPCLTIGVEIPGGMQGAACLNTEDLAPGMVKVIEDDMYKSCMDPHKIQLFRLPLPDSEDRDYFRELGTT